MRKIYLPWLIAVFGIFGTSYGAYLLVYHLKHSTKISAGSLVLLIFGIISLILFISFYISYHFSKKNKKNDQTNYLNQQVTEVKKIEPVKEEIKPANKKLQNYKKEYTPYENHSRYDNDYSSTVYVNKVGYGPILRVEGNRILDIRTNIYYRIENNMVKQEGSGPLYEIRGNQIKNVFGGYLFELSGSNINKVFGGFYASISGNYITLYDLSVKYELSSSLSKTQLLAVIALLFGK